MPLKKKRGVVAQHSPVRKKVKTIEEHEVIIILDTPSTGCSRTSTPVTKFSSYVFYDTSVKRKLDFSNC